jgi:hypothetical protein
MPSDARRAKGTNFIELVKALKVHRRTHPIVGLSRAAEDMLGERILLTNWYPLPPLLEILEYIYRNLLDGDPKKAYELGVVGAEVQLKGPHRAFVVPGDPQASVMALRHIWPSYFDFGELQATLETERSVVFTFKGYPDLPEVQGHMFPAWEVVAARLAGSKRPSSEILGRPWKGDRELVYRISF